MTIIDNEGNIHEGQALSKEELAVYNVLGDEIWQVSQDYISTLNASKIAAFLFNKYNITLRIQAVEVIKEPTEIPQPALYGETETKQFFGKEENNN